MPVKNLPRQLRDYRPERQPRGRNRQAPVAARVQGQDSQGVLSHLFFTPPYYQEFLYLCLKLKFYICFET